MTNKKTTKKTTEKKADSEKTVKLSELVKRIEKLERMLVHPAKRG